MLSCLHVGLAGLQNWVYDYKIKAKQTIKKTIPMKVLHWEIYVQSLEFIYNSFLKVSSQDVRQLSKLTLNNANCHSKHMESPENIT